MTSHHKIVVCSDSDYERLIAEIYVDEKFVALVSQEEGAENFKIEFPGLDQNENAVCRVTDLKCFLDAVEAAKSELTREIH